MILEIGNLTRADVVAEARTWIGTPFRHQARLRGVGVDCAGLVIGVARALGIVEQWYDVIGYPRTPDGSSLRAECDRMMIRVPRSEMGPGDVLLIRWETDPQHMGILGDYLHGGLSLIHALGTTDGRGRVVEHRLTPQTLAKAVQAYALPGVE